MEFKWYYRQLWIYIGVEQEKHTPAEHVNS